MYYNFGRQGKNLLLSIQSFSSVNLVSYINLCLTHFFIYNNKCSNERIPNVTSVFSLIYSIYFGLFKNAKTFKLQTFSRYSNIERETFMIY